MIGPRYSELRQLSPAERIQLAQDLWDSIPEDPRLLLLTESQIAELDGRLGEHERDPSSGLAWEDVRARLRERFGG